MKKLNYLILGLLTFSLIYAGCNKIEEATDVEFNANYDATLNASVPAPELKAAFIAEDDINPLENSDVSQYIDKIKDVEIQTMTATITAIDKDVMLLSGDLDIYTDANKASWSLKDVPLTQGAELSLGNENGEWNTVRAIFAEKKTFMVKLRGSTDKGAVSFTTKVTIGTKMTANPL
jgi:hypothetical protein